MARTTAILIPGERFKIFKDVYKRQAGMDERFGFSVEGRYADANMAESFNCLPTTGRLPEKENEVALSSMILELSLIHI